MSTARPAAGVQVWRIGWKGALSLASLPFGSLLADGRWHVAADRVPVVYAGGTRALCQLERRVHCNGCAPKDMVLLRLALPKGARLEDASPLLPANWRSDMGATQAIGADWARSGRSLGLWVPSYVETAERNLVINPSHPQYSAIVLHVEKNPFEFDPRLFA
ncbi:MAG TPA: RES family NAD+ phosphorylase [Ramlibacter sp.]|uniref:RES family NAD+ phosphorylase n=1 Tax=Ramlibacter sp. TaxID=1917967 RepID=UPI002BE5D80E|nr:RES family NAD+ phosphorylase [Ramlibacter sp.]HVZ45861.1 RES family NAD+ phosphorylase [Ramlibacter sp.]